VHSLFTRIVALVLGCIGAGAAHAQDFPTKPVRIIVASAPGGPVDVAARTLAENLSRRWKQSVVVDNRTGASEIIGTDAAARAPADGYTLLCISLNPLTINPAVYPKLPYDPDKSLVAVAPISTNGMAFVALSKAPFANLQELIAYSKAQRAPVAWSSPGNATNNHIAGEWFAGETGARMLHVPYKGGPAAVNAVLAGEVQVGVVSLNQALPFEKAGTLKVLAVTSLERSKFAPNWPTVAEAAVRGFDASVRSAMFAPVGLPREIADRIRADVHAVVSTPEFAQQLEALGAEPWLESPPEVLATIRRVRTKVGEVVTRTKITLN
jgi:tripartite-type tricarboxylate transporter receptor subunit TctC